MIDDPAPTPKASSGFSPSGASGAGAPGKNGARRGGPRPPEDLARLFESPPPHAPEAEMALLGSMILEPGVIGEVLPLIAKPEAFYLEKHTHIY